MDQFSASTDEELLLLSRMGDMRANLVLNQRYCGPARINHIRQAAPDMLGRFSLWEVSSVALRVFWKCLDGYRFGRAKFFTYYITALRFALYRFQVEQTQNASTNVSLDSYAKRDATLTLHDVVSGEGDLDDPRMYVNYFETLQKYNRLPAVISQDTLDVAKLRSEGLTFFEIASALHMTYRQARSRYEKYLEIVRKEFGTK